jgi:prepilin-type N-terminal cleavage/methylation domain-containing protein
MVVVEDVGSCCQEASSVGRGGRRAFTLVELLVVIGIIALLISILLPSLSRARESANTIKCAANLRSLYQATLLYSTEYKGWMMPATAAGSNTADGNWWGINLLGPQFGFNDADTKSAAQRDEVAERVAKMLDCPSSEKVPDAVYKADYIYNGWFGDFRAYTGNAAYAQYTYRKVTQIPSNVLIAMDVNSSKTTLSDDRFYSAYGTSGAPLQGNISGIKDPLDRPLNLAGNPHGPKQGKNRKANMVFMNGAVITGEPQLIEDYMVRFPIRGNKDMPLPWQ